MDDRTKRRLIKILALANRGIGGEKINAQNILKKRLEKYGITIDDIDDERPKLPKHYCCKNVYEKKLLHQIFAFVTNTHRPLTSVEAKRVYFKATAIEHIEIEAMFAYYRRLMKEENELFYIAFINKHDIFCDEARRKSSKNIGSDGLKQGQGQQLASMMRGLRDEKFISAHKQLVKGEL